MKYLIPVVLVLIAALVGCAKKAPLTPVTPWADVANDSLCFFTISTDPGGLKVCYVFDWGDGDTTTTGYFLSDDTGYCLHEFTDTRVRYIRTKARNEKGVESGWSPSLRFRQSEPPQLADTIFGLPRWAADRWYHASVRVTDPDADSVAVKLVWDDSLATGWSALVPSGGTVRDSCKWSTTGPHTVRVVLRDKGCTVSRPGAVKTVSVSRMAVIWENYDEGLYYSATPTLGSLNGEPVLYGVSIDEALDCFTLNGRRLWSAPLGCEPSGYAPSLTTDGERLYLACCDSGLFCLDARTGKKIWSLALADPAYCTPAIGPDNAIYVVASYWTRELCRVRDCGDSGVVEWSIPLGDMAAIDDGAVVGRNGNIYAVGYDCLSECSFLVAVDTAGNVLWKDSARIQSGDIPVIDGRDRVVVADWNCVYCFNPDGSLAWSAPTDELCANSTAIGRNDEVIVTDDNGNVLCLDANGSQRWSLALHTSGENTPCVAEDSTIIVYDVSGHVYGVGDDGGLLWDFSIFDSLGLDRRLPRRLEGDGYTSPVIGPNGDLYLADDCCGLMCIAHGGLRMANTAWPTYNHDAARSGWAGRQWR